jgi:hypothetical protein
MWSLDCKLVVKRTTHNPSRQHCDGAELKQAPLSSCSELLGSGITGPGVSRGFLLALAKATWNPWVHATTTLDQRFACPVPGLKRF